MDTTSPLPNIPKKEDIDDAGRFFRYMAEFVGFTESDANAIRESGLIVEKHLPAIIGNFYTNLLQYPPTRKFFQKKDGSIDDDYLKLRMYHQANFWRRTAGGVYDDDYAHFVDYVGRAHTSRGADPRLYIAERYVIGMVGFVQHAIIDALIRELHEYDDELEERAIKAWNKLCMVILEMLARAYLHEREVEPQQALQEVDSHAVMHMSIESYEKGLGLQRIRGVKQVFVGQEGDIPEGERKIIEVDGVSIGVFHHKGGWYALRNSCLHRGGPVATGSLIGDNLVCPWHGYTYDVTQGGLLIDPTAKLEMYPVNIQEGAIYLKFPEVEVDPPHTHQENNEVVYISKPVLKENEFFVKDVPPGRVKLVHIDGKRVAVFNVDGVFYATSEECTHAGGPLSEGELDGKNIVCPWHYSCFDVTNGTATCRPAVNPLKVYKVVVDGGIGRVS